MSKNNKSDNFRDWLGADLETLSSRSGVRARSLGNGPAIVVFPGMEGSGESCLQIVAEVLQRLRNVSIRRRLVLIDYSSEDCTMFSALVETIKTVLIGLDTLNQCTFWGQSFGNLLACAVANSGDFDISNLLLVSPFESLPNLKIRAEVLSSRYVPVSINRYLSKPLGRYIFGPCGDQPDHPFFTALERTPPSVFGRRTDWLSYRSFSDYFEKLRWPTAVWLGAEDRLLDLPRQHAFFRGLVGARAGWHFDSIAESGHVVLPTRAVSWLSQDIFRALQQNLWVKGPWKKALRGKVQSRDFPTALGNPATACISTFSTTPATTVNFPISPQKENS